MLQRRLPLILSVIIIALIIAPYLFALSMNTDASAFGGFLINPVDGHSYLAKMQQGFRGEWRFALPYTSDPGSGAYLFLFYILLGHLSRILSLPLIFVFHASRVLGAIFLIGVLYLLNARMFENDHTRNAGFAISALGSGLGWVAIFAGMFTGDFWVAEAYPFLSMYTNPHFSIGLALMILILLPGRKTSVITELALGFLLGIIQPFAVVIVFLVRVVSLALVIFGGNIRIQSIFSNADFLATVGFGFSGGLVLIYQYWSIMSDPVLLMWNSQNITESPAILDLVISLSPALFFAIFGLVGAWREDKSKRLVIWGAVSLLLVLVPWNLQRRFLTGIFVPLGGLAIFGLIELERAKRFSFKAGLILLLIFSIPTNLIVLISGIQASSQQDPQIFFGTAIYEGLDWINENADEDALVLADEDIGLLVPSRTGRSVIYGHPFETINAESERKFLKEFFEINQDEEFYQLSISERAVDLVFLNGESSESLEEWIISNNIELNYENDLVRIYQVGN